MQPLLPPWPSRQSVSDLATWDRRSSGPSNSGRSPSAPCRKRRSKSGGPSSRRRTSKRNDHHDLCKVRLTSAESSRDRILPEHRGKLIPENTIRQVSARLQSLRPEHHGGGGRHNRPSRAGGVRFAAKSALSQTVILA